VRTAQHTRLRSYWSRLHDLAPTESQHILPATTQLSVLPYIGGRTTGKTKPIWRATCPAASGPTPLPCSALALIHKKGQMLSHHSPPRSPSPLPSDSDSDLDLKELDPPPQVINGLYRAAGSDYRTVSTSPGTGIAGNKRVRDSSHSWGLVDTTKGYGRGF